MNSEDICRYEITEQLAQGGMGVVYLGKDTETDDIVAIKALQKNLIGSNDEWRTRFLREGEVLRDLNHPNIVKMLAMCEEDGQHYIIMEYIDGGSLVDKIAENSRLLPIVDVLDIALQLADALTRAHYLRIIHRDLKPANVLISSEGRACLTDFGLAQTGPSELTADGAIMGTLGYLSPEVVEGQEATERSDIWSFGVLLFEMLTGLHPFLGDTTSATLFNILSEPPPDLESLRPDIPIQLVDLTYRMLQKDPAQRISSVRQIGSILEAIGQNEDVGLVTRDPAADRFKTPTSSDSARITRTLPSDLTPFVGRAKEVAELTELLIDDRSRLVTVVGPGGSGKTRLAIETARSISNQFRDGAAFIPLAALDSIDSLIPAIWEAVEYPPVHADTRTPEEQTIDFFNHKEMLLIFDNCEHLLDGAELIVGLLRSASDVRVLATTTERLNVRGETMYRLEGIDYPDEEDDEDAINYAAVQLFIETSSRWRPRFEVSEDNLPYIVRVCQLVQGLPLGILLASAWVDVLSVEAITKEITADLDFLASDMRDIPDRQRSIRAVFEGAWRRLSSEEQYTFMRLAIFRGGFDLEAAQAIASATVRNLLSLTNKSLLWRDPDTGRYGIHRLLRQYAQQELENSGELDIVQRKHAEHYADLAEMFDEHLREPHELLWYDRIREENDNFIAALDWALVQEKAPVIGGRLFAALAAEWFLTDNVVDGTNWMERSLKVVDALPDDVRARVYNRSGLICCVQGTYAQATDHHANSVQLLRSLGDEGLLAYALMAQANMSYAAGMGKVAYPLVEESLVHAYRAEDPFYLAASLSTAALFSRRAGNASRARQLLLERINLAASFPNDTIRCGTLRAHAFMARHDGDLEQAMGKFEEALGIARELNWRPTELDTLEEIAYTYYLKGDLQQAEGLFSDALQQGRDINHFDLIVWNLVGLGMIALIQKSKMQAYSVFKERLMYRPAEGSTWQIALCIAGIGKLAWLDGKVEVAARLLGASEAMVESGDLLPFPWFTDEWQKIIGDLKPRADNDLWEQGKDLSGQQVIDCATGQFSPS